MNWTELRQTLQLEEIDERSKTNPQIIFKHSTRCNISTDAYNEISRCDLEIYFLDLLAHRDISNEIAARYNVVHKSPQVLIIKNGTCVYHESHWNIKCSELNKILSESKD